MSNSNKVNLTNKEIIALAQKIKLHDYITGDDLIQSLYILTHDNNLSIIWNAIGLSKTKLSNFFDQNKNIKDESMFDQNNDFYIHILDSDHNIIYILSESIKYFTIGFKRFLSSNKITLKSIKDNISKLEQITEAMSIDVYEFLGMISDNLSSQGIDHIDENYKFEFGIMDSESNTIIDSKVTTPKSKKSPTKKPKSEYIYNMSDTDLMDNNGENSDKSDNDSNVVIDKKETETKKLAVEYFATNLTKEAANDQMDPIIGRSKEIDQLIYTLLRKTKNNPILIGEPGVGKTAVVEGLAQKIAKGDVPNKLKEKNIYMVDMGSMVAGTKYRGEFESRLKSIIDEAMDPSLNIILFIDEIHTIIGAGSAEGTGDAANMLKPALARGKIKLIGATTYDEYQKYIEKDAALKRRFQEVMVDEPSVDNAITMLMGLKPKYEDFHGVNISEEAIKQSVLLTKRYMMNRYLPDKAIDILDEAAARKSTIVSKLDNDDDHIKFTKKLEKIEEDIKKAVANQDYFLAAKYKTDQAEIKKEINKIRNQNLLPNHLRPTVDLQDIGLALSEKVGIPANVVTESEITKLKRLENDLNKKIIGQNNVISSISKAIQRSRLSSISKNRPIASFLFVGPSGTGKTHVAKTIAEDYFGDNKSLIRVDMSELMERHSVSKLIGSAPGYVGYEEGGNLTEQIRRRPYSVVLFDEIEKADSSVLNILLQILDEGQIKDNKGRLIDFKSTIIIMTSNIGSEMFSKKGNIIGFNLGENVKEEFQNFETIKDRVIDKLKDTIIPELLNRIDYKIVFKPLTKQDLSIIFQDQFDEFIKMRSDRSDIKLPKYNSKQISEIIDKIYDPQYGARPISQYIYNEIEPKIIDQIMENA